MTKLELSFSRTDSAKFFRTLNKRINTYFKDNKIKKTGNWKLYSKAIIMFAIFLVPLILILTLNLPTLGTNIINYYHWNWNGWSWYECDA